jgi:hypothetical protein
VSLVKVISLSHIVAWFQLHDCHCMLNPEEERNRDNQQETSTIRNFKQEVHLSSTRKFGSYLK